MNARDYNDGAYRNHKCGYPNPGILRDASKKICLRVRKKFPNGTFIFVGSGGSGSALATACVLNSRKRAYLSISPKDLKCVLESAIDLIKDNTKYVPVIVFVDDHIGTKSTLMSVAKILYPYAIDLAISITKNCSPILEYTTDNGKVGHKIRIESLF